MTLNDLWSEAREECSQRIKDIRSTPFRITCFSNFDDVEELGKNTAMWSHYADNHRDFCVRYSLDLGASPIKSIIKCGLYKVIYSARISKASPRELMKLKYDGDSMLHLNEYLTKTIYRALVTKSRFWNYEKEWRLIIGKEHFGVLQDGYLPFPFVETVFLGCGIEESLRRHIVQFARLNSIPVYQAQKSSERFNLDFWEIAKPPADAHYTH
jgi:hypothetical protein